MAITAEFPEHLQCLFQPKRYKVLYGGRGAGRSWGAARALLLIGTEKPIRVLCARELQNSIAESVHKLLSDQIDALGLMGCVDSDDSKRELGDLDYFQPGVGDGLHLLPVCERSAASPS